MAALPPAVRNQLSAMGQGDSLPQSSLPRSGSGGMGTTKRGTAPSQRPPTQRTPAVPQPVGFSAAPLRSQPHTPAPARMLSARGQPPRPPTHATPSASRNTNSAAQFEAATPGWRQMRQLYTTGRQPNTTGRRATDSGASLGDRRRSAVTAPQRIHANTAPAVRDTPRRSTAAEQEGIMAAALHVSAFLPCR